MAMEKKSVLDFMIIMKWRGVLYSDRRGERREGREERGERGEERREVKREVRREERGERREGRGEDVIEQCKNNKYGAAE